MYELAIERGMSLLDERCERWVEFIDLEILDVSDVCNCVIGQVFRVAVYSDYRESLRALANMHKNERSDAIFAWAERYGFDLPGHDNGDAYEDLTNEWIAAIAARSAP